MNLDEFYRQIPATRLRAAELYQRAGKSLVQQQELLVEGFEELYTALEKLEVGEEKLRQQNQELVAVHKLVQVERERYQDLLEFLPDAYLVTDGKGIIREANGAAAKLLNVPQQFIVGKVLALFVSKEERSAFFSSLTRLRQHDSGQEWEVRLVPRNAKPIDVTLTVATFPNQEGKPPVLLRWLLRDISEGKRVASKLRLLSYAAQQANESIVITSAELDKPGPKILFVNPAFTKMTGYTAEEIIGKTPRILQGPKTDRSVLNRLRRSMSQGQIFHGETINYHKDGTEYNVELSCSPIQNECGEITHFVSIQRDITVLEVWERETVAS